MSPALCAGSAGREKLVMQSLQFNRLALPALLAGLVTLASLPGAQAQDQREREIPADTVVRATLDDHLSSRDARVGDPVTAVVDDRDRSGFPQGTRLEGRVTEAQRSNDNRPGIIDVQFDRAVLPGGKSLAVEGRLSSLNDDDVQRNADGRLETRHRSGRGSGHFDAKWVGYGAAGGAVLGTIFGGSFLKGALLGAAGGAIYSYLNKGKGGRDRYHDVELERGSAFGVRLNQRVAFADLDDYRYYSGPDDRDADPRDQRVDDRRDSDRQGDNQVLGSREEWRFGDTRVRFNGEDVTFTDARPMNLNGVLYVPLQPVADAARMRYTHRLGDETFTLFGRDGALRGRAGDAVITMANDRTETLDASPASINGEIYVPVEYLSRVADMTVNWDRRNMRLDLETDR